MKDYRAVEVKTELPRDLTIRENWTMKKPGNCFTRNTSAILLQLHNNALNFKKVLKNIFLIFTFYKTLLRYILFLDVCCMFGFVVGNGETVFGKQS